MSTFTLHLDGMNVALLRDALASEAARLREVEIEARDAADRVAWADARYRRWQVAGLSADLSDWLNDNPIPEEEQLMHQHNLRRHARDLPRSKANAELLRAARAGE